MELFWLYSFGLWVGSVALAVQVSDARGNSVIAGVILGVLFGPFGAAATLALPKNMREMDRRALLQRVKRQCPACAELIRPEARVCRYCSAASDPAPASAPPKPLTRAEIIQNIGRE